MAASALMSGKARMGQASQVAVATVKGLLCVFLEGGPAGVFETGDSLIGSVARLHNVWQVWTTSPYRAIFGRR